MDYRALAELIWFSLMGLAVLGLAGAISIRVFLAPVIREVIERLGSSRSDEQARLAAHLEVVESRLAEAERELGRLRAADDFHRSLEAGPDRGPGATDHDREPGASPRGPLPAADESPT